MHRLFESSLENKEEPCCSKNINPVTERKKYCPAICNNPFSTSTIEEHADLCLENKNKFFFERQPKSSDDEKSVSMIDEKTEMRGHLDQTKLAPAIYRQLQRQGRSQNLKQVPQNFMKVFNVDEVTVSS